MSKTKQQLWTKFGGKEFFARMADNATHDGDGNEISTTYATKDAATTSADGLMSAADKGKLDNIESSAEVNLIETVSVAGTALEIESKSVNVPEAGGTTGAWVKGVVSGEDKSRWDSWEDISVTIPNHSFDDFLYLTYFENLEYYDESRITDTPVIGDITYYSHSSGYGTVPSTINEYVASSYTGLPAMTVLASSSRKMTVENRQGFDIRSTVLDLLQSVETFSFEVILNIGSFAGLWGGLAFGCSAGQSNYSMNVNVYESSRGLGIGLPGWYGTGTNRCTATDNFYLKSYDSGRDVHAVPNDAAKLRAIGIHHLAVVVDRTANEARGYFDGELAIRRPTISEIGNIVNYSFTNEMNDTLQYTQFAIREGDCSTNGGLNYPVPTKPYVKF